MAKHYECTCGEDVCLSVEGVGVLEDLARLIHEDHDRFGFDTCDREACIRIRELVTD